MDHTGPQGPPQGLSASGFRFESTGGGRRHIACGQRLHNASQLAVHPSSSRPADQARHEEHAGNLSASTATASKKDTVDGTLGVLAFECGCPPDAGPAALHDAGHIIEAGVQGKEPLQNDSVTRKSAILHHQGEHMHGVPHRHKPCGAHPGRQTFVRPPHIKCIGGNGRHRLYECLGCGASGFRFESTGGGRRHIACRQRLHHAPHLAAVQPSSPNPADQAHEEHEDHLLLPHGLGIVAQAASVMASAAQSLDGAVAMYEMLAAARHDDGIGGPSVPAGRGLPGGHLPADVKRALSLVVTWVQTVTWAHKTAPPGPNYVDMDG